jgi:hypothetical protein
MLRLIIVEDYFMTFKLQSKMRNNTERLKNKKRASMVIIIYILSQWMTRCAYLKLLSAKTFIQCCWMQVQERKELQRLQQEANEFSIKLIGDSRMSRLEERRNDTIKARSSLDFGLKCSTIQFYAIEDNSKSNHWIELKLYQRISEVFVYD